MKKILVLPIFILAVAVVSSQPQYSFGTMQRDQEINILRGDSYTTEMYFYNVFGNRITHVLLSLTGDHPEWAKIEPEVHVAQFEVAGQICNSTENLYVEPMGFVKKEGAPEPPEGVVYIQAPMRGDSWIPAKVAKLTISVPEDAELGSYSFKVSAVASWFPETGCVAEAAAGAMLQQARDFDFTIHVLYPGEFYERPVTPPAPPFWEQIPTEYIIFAVVIVIAMAGMYYLGKRGR
jgi:hypothetical protein